MPRRRDRWVEVTPSEFAHERNGLRYLQEVIPDAAPYRVWTNFEFKDEQGNWSEVDALVLGRGRLHLVELKHYSGVLAGTEALWRRNGRTSPSPLLLARKKAKRLRGRIFKELRSLSSSATAGEDATRWVPYIQECVFLHGVDLEVQLTPYQAADLFGFPEARNALKDIRTRLTEPPDRQVITDRDGDRLAAVLGRIGDFRNPLRPAGSWQLTADPLGEGDGWQDWAALHSMDADRTARIRVFVPPPGSTTAVRNAVARRVQQEFRLLRTLHHDSIVVPVDQVEDFRGDPALVFEDDPAATPLSQLAAPLTYEQKLQVLLTVAQTLDYAHRQGVAHRGLYPGRILVDPTASPSKVRLADWSSAARVHGAATTTLGTHLGTPTDFTEDGSELFEAPEGRWSTTANRPALDIFALGAVAYWMITGSPPATSRAALRTVLRDSGGLDLAAGAQPFADDDLRALIRHATDPRVPERLASAAEFAARVSRILSGPDPAISVETDPLTAPIGAVLGGRFEVHQDLGSGSTAKGIRVRDHRSNDTVVLKVALNDAAAERLRAEAAVLDAVDAALPQHPHLVRLLEREPEIGAGRVALVLSDGGEDTLASQLRHGAMSVTNLAAIGGGLLDVVVDLDRVGISHRDIKPANIGLAARFQGPSTPVLFDFSLTSGVSELSAGTPPYLDPFLGDDHRGSYDSAAERYAVAVVLFEMATGRQPRYGDGSSNPAVIADEVAVDPTAFPDLPRAVASALAPFFQVGLARDSRRRHDTPDAMRTAWREALRAVDTGGRRGAVGGPRTRAAVGTPGAAEPLATMSDLLAEMVRTTRGTARKLIQLALMPTHATSRQPDPMDTMSVLADLLGVTPAAVSQQFPKLGETWFPAGGELGRVGVTLHGVAAELHARLAAAGGVTTADALAEAVTDLLPAGPQMGETLIPARGLLRIVLELQSRFELGGSERWERRRHQHRPEIIAIQPLLLECADEVAAAARRAVSRATAAGEPLVAAAAALPELREAYAGRLDHTPDDRAVPDSSLLQLAAAAPGVALTQGGDLYSVDLPLDRALAVVLTGLPDDAGLDPAALRRRLHARFPALTAELPTRPELDVLLRAAHRELVWSPDRGIYVTTGGPDPTGSTLSTRAATQHPEQHAPADLSWLPRGGGPVFRIVLVPLGMSDRFADGFRRRLGAEEINVSDLVLSAMRSQADASGVPWAELLATDAGSAADRSSLTQFVQQHVPAVPAAVERSGPPVVLTDLSILQAYNRLDVLARWTDLTRPPPRTVVVVVPEGDNGERAVNVAKIGLNSPDQRVRLTRSQVDAIADVPTTASAHRS